MPTPVRFPGGVTTVTPSDLMGMFGMPDPTKWHTFFDDFDRYVAGDFVVTNVGVATEALADGDGGNLLLTNAAADNDACFLQKVGESFKFELGKKLFFKARFKVSEATQSDFVVGLQITDTSPLAVTDGVFFLKSDASATVDMLVTKNSAITTLASVATIVADTYIVLGFYYDGVSKIRCYVDGTKISDAVVTNMPDDEDMTVSFGIQNGDAVARTMTVDYLLAAKER